MFVLTPDFGTEENVFKMASIEEVLYMKKFRIIETSNFDVGSSSSDLILRAEAMLEVLRFCIQSTVRPIMPPRRPHMKKYSTWIVFVSSSLSILIFESSQSEVVCKKLEPKQCSCRKKLEMARLSGRGPKSPSVATGLSGNWDQTVRSGSQKHVQTFCCYRTVRSGQANSPVRAGNHAFSRI